jgi:hypothetical protein
MFRQPTTYYIEVHETTIIFQAYRGNRSILPGTVSCTTNESLNGSERIDQRNPQRARHGQSDPTIFL